MVEAPKLDFLRSWLGPSPENAAFSDVADGLIERYDAAYKLERMLTARLIMRRTQTKHPENQKKDQIRSL